MMFALDTVRSAEIEMDMELGPIEECYAFLQHSGVYVPREEAERVDSIRYTFKNLQAQSVGVVCPTNKHDIYHSIPINQNSVQEYLVSIQPQFRENLLEAVKVFKSNTDSFLAKYAEVGGGYCH